jgi:hypothetical protein
MSSVEDRLWFDLVRDHGDELAEATWPTASRNRPRPVWLAGGALIVAGAATAVALALTSQTSQLPPAQIRALERAHIPYISANFPASSTGLSSSFGAWLWRVPSGVFKGSMIVAWGTSKGINLGGCQTGLGIRLCLTSSGPESFVMGTVDPTVQSIVVHIGSQAITAAISPSGSGEHIWVVRSEALWRSPTAPVTVVATGIEGARVFAASSNKIAREVSRGAKQDAARTR